MTDGYASREAILRWKAITGPAHALYEKPAIFSLLDYDLNGLNVLAVGCGTGEECHDLKGLGANVVGSDKSSQMIAMAQTNYPDMPFVVTPMERLGDRFGTESFDLIFSSLVLHYTEDLTKVLGDFAEILTATGKIVLSMHHPVYWGASREENDGVKIKLLGSKQTASEVTHYGDYMTNRQVTTRMGDDFEATFYHHNLSTIINSILHAGLKLETVLEPLPQLASKISHPDFYERAARVPLFILFRLSK